MATDDYSVNQLYAASWIVYINGLEIPVMSATANFGVWQIPTATIQLVPHPMLQRIGAEDRLQVVIFYLDNFWFAKNPQYCYLGEFEVTGWSYTNTGRGRSFQLECVGHDQILEQLKFYYMSSVDDIAGAEFSTAGVTTTKVSYPACLFMEGLTSKIDLPASGVEESGTEGFLKRPIDFVLNIFRALLSPVNTTSSTLGTDGTIPTQAVTAPSKNFFARWLKLTGYHKRWCALPYLEDSKDDCCFPILKAVRDTETLKALQDQLGQRVGEAGSAWDLLQYVLGAMYMEIAMIPSPPMAAVEKITGVIQSSGTTVPAANQFRGILSRFVKPQCVFALPPTCNVVFPSMVDSFTMQETYITQPTRIYLSEDFITNMVSNGNGPSLAPITQNLLGTGYPPPVRTRMRSTSVGRNNKSFLLYPEEFFKGPVVSRLNGPPWMYMLAQSKNLTLTEGANADEAAAQQAYEEDVTGEGSSADTTYATSGDTGASLLGSIFDAYAEYEFYRSRYSQRNGALQLAWNPYVVPGFPLAVFDQLASGCHCMSYANTVSQQFNAGPNPSLSTSVNMSFVRTMPEFMGVIGDTTTFSAELDVSPVEVIPEISLLLQKTDNAQKFYERLFFRGRNITRPAVFDWKKMLSLHTSSGKSIDPAKQRTLMSSDMRVTPKAEFMPLFDNYTAAMGYVSRPVCTLTEYVEAYHGKPVKDLVAAGVLRGGRSTAGATYWSRIYKLVQGPGTDPGETATNVGAAPEYPPAPVGSLKLVDRSSGMAETRKDWDKVLENYRKIVLGDGGRIAPQQ